MPVPFGRVGRPRGARERPYRALSPEPGAVALAIQGGGDLRHGRRGSWDGLVQPQLADGQRLAPEMAEVSTRILRRHVFAVCPRGLSQVARLSRCIAQPRGTNPCRVTGTCLCGSVA